MSEKLSLSNKISISISSHEIFFFIFEIEIGGIVQFACIEKNGRRLIVIDKNNLNTLAKTG